MASITSSAVIPLAAPAKGGDARRVVRAFLKTAFPGHELGDADDMFELGYANSLFALELVEFVEGAFELRVEDEDLDLQNFRSIDAIARFVERKLRPEAGG